VKKKVHGVVVVVQSERGAWSGGGDACSF